MHLTCNKLLFFFIAGIPLVSSSEEIPIGAIMHLTGDQASQGKALLEGVQLAVDKVNSSKQCGPHTLKLFVEDSQLKPKDAHLVAKRLISLKKIKVAVNSSYLESMANGKEFESAKVPVVTLWDSAPQIEDIGEYVFAIGIWSPSAGEGAAEFAFHQLKAKTAGVISMENEWSVTVGEVFEKKFKDLGGSVLSANTVSTTTSDFRSVLTKVISLNPDVIYSPVTDNVVAFYTQVRELGFKGQIISSDIITNEHIKIAPNLFNGIYQTQAQDPETPKAQEVAILYLDKFKKAPDQLSLTVLGYDGIQVLCSAIKSAGSDSVKIKDEIYKIKNFEGASGSININEKGSSKVLEKIYQIKGSGFVGRQ